MPIQPSAAGPASPAPDGSADIASVRNATNWRAVQRFNPDLAEILDTSTYCVIYLYNEQAAKWEKQKQEGPLFVVRRTAKSPEYALFMLNRQTVKNVTIPLYPGEMKVKAIDASMLQVARRGEKNLYGIWFTEGTETVQRFRETIFKIVGEPSKNAGGARASPAQSAQAPPAQASTEQTGDGLSRLFAGLTTIPAGSLPQSQSHSQSHSPQPPASQPPQAQPQPPQPQPQYTSPQQYPPYGQAGYAPPTHPHFQPYPAAYAQYAPGSASPAQQYQQQPPAPVIAGPVAPYRPGETVDDLLKGMLGGIAPMPGAPAGGPPHSAPSTAVSSTRNSPPGSKPSQASPAASRPGQNGTPQASAPPAEMRDALVNTFAPEGSHPPPMGRDQLLGDLVRLLQTNAQFGEDVWRAYSARSMQ